MGMQLTADWCQKAWNIFLYLESIYDFLEETEKFSLKGDKWYADPEDGNAGIYFSVKPKSEKGKSWLQVALYFERNRAYHNKAIWIELLRDLPQLEENIRKEFPEALVEEGTFGLDLPFSEDAGDNEVQAAAKKLADRIIKVLLPI